ncbi:facilitated trehalose transporter Tret1-like isoform X2 [Planococcus citri]|uniref:facilitated trehalose transporter Tret1-like isoform X2 n=1 Tax=Planococcus citri TaxID=170843 RepID=UPI0031F8D8D7
MATFLSSEIFKEAYIACLTFTAFIMVAACRGFVAFQLPQLKSPGSDIRVTEDEASWIATLTILPNPIGCVLGGMLMDLIGRKTTLQLIFIPFAVAWAIIGFSVNVQMLYIGTFIAGVAAGACYCSSTYIAEVCSPEHRGPLLGFLEPTYTFGILICNLLVHNFGWRVSALGFIIVSCVCFVLLFFLPESPSWLVTKGRNKKALSILTWIRGNPGDAEREIAEIENSLGFSSKDSKTISGSLHAVMKSWKPLVMLIGLVTLQRVCGCPILESYTVEFFGHLKLPFDSSLAAIYHSTTNFITSFFTPFAVQKTPRRVLLGVTSFVMGIAMLVVTVYEMNFHGDQAQPYFWIVLASVYIYDVASTLGVLPLPFILSGELFPTKNRGALNGIYGCFSFLISAAVVKTFTRFLDAIGIVNVVFSYAIVCFITIAYGKFILPETSNKTLPEIQIKYFNKKTKKQVDDNTYVEEQA